MSKRHIQEVAVPFADGVRHLQVWHCVRVGDHFGAGCLHDALHPAQVIDVVMRDDERADFLNRMPQFAQPTLQFGEALRGIHATIDQGERIAFEQEGIHVADLKRRWERDLGEARELGGGYDGSHTI